MRPHINFTRELLASSARVRDNIGVSSIKIIRRSQRTSRAYQIVRPILSVGPSVRFLKDSFDRIVLSRSDYQLLSRRPSPCSVRKSLPQLATFFYVRRHEEVVCRGTHILTIPTKQLRQVSSVRHSSREVFSCAREVRRNAYTSIPVNSFPGKNGSGGKGQKNSTEMFF